MIYPFGDVSEQPAAQASARPDAYDDFWYHTYGSATSAGVNVTHDNALRASAVFGCVRAIAESIGSLPLGLFQRDERGNKLARADHPTYSILHDQPNDEQTAIEFREQLQAWASARGTAVAEKIPGARGAVDQLVPLHPDDIEFQARRTFTGRRVWSIVHAPIGEPSRELRRDQLFILRGLGIQRDSIQGIDPILTNANTVGAGLAAQDYANRFFANDATPSGLLTLKTPLRDQESRDNLQSSWQRSRTGTNRHKTALLPFDVEYHQVGLTNEQAQFLETRRYTDLDICRIFRVPPHVVGILDEAKWANIEQQAIDWVQGCLLPWLVRWEQAIKRDLLTDPGMFAEHNVAGLLRGDQATRYAAYAVGRNWGWLSVNDVRRLENMNAVEGGDTYLQPLNMQPIDAAAQPQPAPQQAEQPPRGYEWTSRASILLPRA